MSSSSGTDILKEFLVAIGFKVNDQQFRRFQDTMRKTANSAIDLAQATAGASTVLGASMRAVAAHMESLYYASQRTGSGVRELQDFGFAASQVGVSAEKAQGAVEALAAARRINPGMNMMLGNLGIDPRQTDNARVLIQLLARLRQMPYYQGAKVAQMFGIDENTFNMLERGLPQMQRFVAMRERMFAAAGVDPQQAARRSHVFMQDFRTLEAGIGNLTDLVAYRLEPAGEKVIGWLEEMVAWLTRADHATHAWSSKILGVMSAFAGLRAIPAILGKLTGKSAVAAKTRAATAAGAAEAGTAVAGGEGAAEVGAASLLGWPALIAAACAAVIVWMTTHPELVRKAAHAAWDETKKGAKEAKHAIVREAKALPGQVTKIEKQVHSTIREVGASRFASIVGTVLAPELTNGILSLADGAKRLISHYEGVLRTPTWDYHGYSIGRGHQIKPGEHFDGPISNAQMDAIFSADVSQKIHEVLSHVHVHLNRAQQAALADLDYNIGDKAFENSTLLKMLNAGNFSGAADQFLRWDKVLKNGHYLVDQGLLARRETERALFTAPDKPNVTISQKTDIHVHGATEPVATSREVAGQQNRVNADLVRNFTGAVQ